MTLSTKQYPILWWMFQAEHLNPMYQNKTRTNLTKDKVIFGKIDFFVLWGKNI